MSICPPRRTDTNGLTTNIMASLRLPVLIRLWPGSPPPVCYTPLLSFLPSLLFSSSSFLLPLTLRSFLGKRCVQPQVWLVELNVPVCFHNTMTTCVLACPHTRAGISQYELTRIFLLVPLMTAVWEPEMNCSCAMFFLLYFGECFSGRDKVNVCLLGCVCEP